MPSTLTTPLAKDSPSLPFLNLGILAHVDVGKTSLTERLLFDAGQTERLGGADSGTTRTDALDQERRRGITIRSAVATFAIGDLTINLIDTPGHPDFIAEVELALRVFDAAILVISTVEGVQPPTRVLLQALRRMRIPTLIFINKIDRTGANADRVLREIPDAVATWTDYDEAVAERNELVLESFAADRPVPPNTLKRLTASRAVMPAFKGSTMTGHGTAELATAIVELLPHAQGNHHGTLCATIFKIEPDRTGWSLVHTGALRIRDSIGDDIPWLREATAREDSSVREDLRTEIGAGIVTWKGRGRH